ncbi:MAG: tetratricopeptide repeat protein [Gemmatimonadaceae bacterium]
MMVLAFAAAVSRPGLAQRLGPAEERPRLRDVADTNDAQAYYNLGLATFGRDVETAAAAFYWAARINPAWGEPLYGRRAALLMKDKHMMARVLDRDRGALESPEVKRLDSLQFRALMLSPFLYRRLERPMFVAYIKEEVMRQSRMTGEDVSPLELDDAIKQYLRGAKPSTRAWAYYSDGNFDAALENYARALETARDKAYLRLERGRIFGMRGATDSAVSEMRIAIEELRKQDKKELVVLYDSKAMTEYSIATLLEGAGDAEGAREAYGEALQEDLSYYPAHMRLGLLALGRRDTTTALSELALAAQLAPGEPHIRYVNGFVLSATRHLPDALKELQTTVELEPYYALPYLQLGRVHEQMDHGPEALASYQEFLARASQTDPQRQWATDRVNEIKEILNPGFKP